MSNLSGQTIWRWDQVEPFGVNVPDEDPDSNSVDFVFPLRFPGQYADKETNLHYNYFRDYDPGIGRYAQSDPLGLRAGLNSYAYVHGDPLALVDPLGLQAQGMSLFCGPYFWLCAGAATAATAIGVQGSINAINSSSGTGSGSPVPLPPSVSGPIPSSCSAPPAANDPGAEDCSVRQQVLLNRFFLILGMQARGINVLRNVYMWYNRDAVIHNIICRHYKVPTFNLGPTGSVP